MEQPAGKEEGWTAELRHCQLSLGRLELRQSAGVEPLGIRLQAAWTLGSGSTTPLPLAQVRAAFAQLVAQPHRRGATLPGSTRCLGVRKQSDSLSLSFFMQLHPSHALAM